VRWPGEVVMIVTPCSADATSGVAGLVAETSADRQELEALAPTQAVLAATQSRLIYQERTSQAVLLRCIALVLGVIAVAVLYVGTGLVSFAAIGVAGLALWAGAKLLELLMVGRTSIDFRQIELLDRTSQRIDGTVRPGVRYRLRIPDPSDFGMIASLVDTFGTAAA
jgi:hypothetical protein